MRTLDFSRLRLGTEGAMSLGAIMSSLIAFSALMVMTSVSLDMKVSLQTVKSVEEVRKYRDTVATVRTLLSDTNSCTCNVLMGSNGSLSLSLKGQTDIPLKGISSFSGDSSGKGCGQSQRTLIGTSVSNQEADFQVESLSIGNLELAFDGSIMGYVFIKPKAPPFKIFGSRLETEMIPIQLYGKPSAAGKIDLIGCTVEKTPEIKGTQASTVKMPSQWGDYYIQDVPYELKFSSLSHDNPDVPIYLGSIKSVDTDPYFKVADQLENGTAKPCKVTGYYQDPTTAPCIHGGEVRYFDINGVSSCKNLVAYDSVDAFNWICKEVKGPNGTVARFVTAKEREFCGTADEKNGMAISMRNLLRPIACSDPNDHLKVRMDRTGHPTTFKSRKGLKDLLLRDRWKKMYVLVYDVRYTEGVRRGLLVARSDAEEWWSNPVVPLMDNGSTSMTKLDNGPARKKNSKAGVVYTISGMQYSSGYQIVEDKVSLVTLNLSESSHTFPLMTGIKNTDIIEFEADRKNYFAPISYGLFLQGLQNMQNTQTHIRTHDPVLRGLDQGVVGLYFNLYKVDTAPVYESLGHLLWVNRHKLSAYQVDQIIGLSFKYMPEEVWTAASAANGVRTKDLILTMLVNGVFAGDYFQYDKSIDYDNTEHFVLHNKNRWKQEGGYWSNLDLALLRMSQQNWTSFLNYVGAVAKWEAGLGGLKYRASSETACVRNVPKPGARTKAMAKREHETCLVSVSNSNFVWVEGSFFGETLADTVLSVSGGEYIKIKNSRLKQARGYGLLVNGDKVGASRILVDEVIASENGLAGIVIGMGLDKAEFRQIVATRNMGHGFMKIGDGAKEILFVSVDGNRNEGDGFHMPYFKWSIMTYVSAIENKGSGMEFSQSYGLFKIDRAVVHGNAKSGISINAERVGTAAPPGIALGLNNIYTSANSEYGLLVHGFSGWLECYGSPFCLVTLKNIHSVQNRKGIFLSNLDGALMADIFNANSAEGFPGITVSHSTLSEITHMGAFNGGSHGIEISDSPSLTMNNLLTNHNKGDGLVISETSSDVSLTRVLASSNDGRGLNLKGPGFTGQFFTVTNNGKDLSGHGVAVSATGVTLNNIVTTNNAGDGLAIANSQNSVFSKTVSADNGGNQISSTADSGALQPNRFLGSVLAPLNGCKVTGGVGAGITDLNCNAAGLSAFTLVTTATLQSVLMGKGREISLASNNEGPPDPMNLSASLAGNFIEGIYGYVLGSTDTYLTAAYVVSSNLRSKERHPQYTRFVGNSGDFGTASSRGRCTGTTCAFWRHDLVRTNANPIYNSSLMGGQKNPSSCVVQGSNALTTAMSGITFLADAFSYRGDHWTEMKNAPGNLRLCTAGEWGGECVFAPHFGWDQGSDYSRGPCGFVPGPVINTAKIVMRAVL